MPNIKYELLKPDDIATFQATIATYWKSLLAIRGVEFDAELTDAEVIQRAGKYVPQAHVMLFAQQLRQCLDLGHVVIAKDSHGKVVGLANYIKMSAEQLNIQDGRGDHVAMITNFKVLEGHNDVATAKKLLTALLDLVDQKGITRIVYGKSYDDSPDLICIDNMFGPTKMGFVSHTDSPYRRPDGELVIAGINGAFMALQTIRAGKVRAPMLKL